MKQLILLLALTATAYAEPLIYMTSSGGGGSFDPSATNAVLVASKAYTNATSNNLWQATSTALNGKLSLSGGTMTGSIASSLASGEDIKKSIDNKTLVLRGGSTSGNSACLILGGKDCSPASFVVGAGGFRMSAQKGEGDSFVSRQLDGKPDGTLTWCGNPILTTADIVDDLSSSATDKALSAKQGKVLSDTISRFTWANSIYVAFSDGSATIPFLPSTSTAIGLSSNTIYCKENSTYKALPRVICFGHTVNCAIGTAVGGIAPLTFSCDTTGVEIEFWVEFTLLKLDDNGYNANQIYHFKRTF